MSKHVWVGRHKMGDRELVGCVIADVFFTEKRGEVVQLQLQDGSLIRLRYHEFHNLPDNVRLCGRAAKWKNDLALHLALLVDETRRRLDGPEFDKKRRASAQKVARTRLDEAKRHLQTSIRHATTVGLRRSEVVKMFEVGTMWDEAIVQGVLES